MPRLIAIEGPESGVALPVLGDETYLAQGPERRVKLSRAGSPPLNGAVIRRADGSYRIARIGATGGVATAPLLVNGEEVEEASLNHGDLITYAGATMIFDCAEVDQNDTAVENKSAAQAGLPLGGESVSFRQKAYADASAAIQDRERDRLAILLKITTAVGATLDLTALLTRLLDLVFDEVPADRGTILLFDKPQKKLKSMVSKRREAVPGEPAVRVSRTMIKEALTTQESILTIDAMADERFRGGESIARAGMRSAMCIPIVRSDRALGVLHLDSTRADRVFTRDDLDLMSSIASVVALAIENARLYQEAAERERLRTELSVATAIQQRLMPKTQPHAPGLDVFGATMPAKELGGDIFDFIEDARRGTLDIVVGDVSGKGVGASLVMAMARSYIRPLSAVYDSPKQILTEANRFLFHDTSREMFMSAILLRWEARAQRLVYCGAGQEHILTVRAGADVCEAQPAGGLALMMVEDATGYLEEKELALARGDLVVLYSDGVIDARNPAGEFYGLERVTALLPAVARLGSAQAAVERIMSEVQAFTGVAEQHDDVTVVALRRT